MEKSYISTVQWKIVKYSLISVKCSHTQKHNAPIPPVHIRN